MEGLASGYPRTLLTAANGTVIEIFEWESEAAAQRAHDNPTVKKLWGQIAELAEFIPLSAVPESQKLFSPFKQIENDRKNRVIHFEIEANEPKKVSQFYQDVFGWEFHQWGENQYWLADTGREPCPGIDGAVMKRIQPESAVTNTIHVESVDMSIKKVLNAGGKVCKPKFAVPGVGFVAYITDPEGNMFGMMQPDMSAK